MIRDITYSDTDLSRKSEDVIPEDINSPKVESIINDMIDTLEHYSVQLNAIGISACQIGEYKKIIVICRRIGFRRTNQVFINLKILEQYGEINSEEGCISLPNRFYVIKRPKTIKVGYYNRQGKYIEEEIRGKLVQILCHEADHGDGITIKKRWIQQLREDEER